MAWSRGVQDGARTFTLGQTGRREVTGVGVIIWQLRQQLGGQRRLHDEDWDTSRSQRTEEPWW